MLFALLPAADKLQIQALLAGAEHSDPPISFAHTRYFPPEKINETSRILWADLQKLILNSCKECLAACVVSFRTQIIKNRVQNGLFAFQDKDLSDSMDQAMDIMQLGGMVSAIVLKPKGDWGGMQAGPLSLCAAPCSLVGHARRAPSIVCCAM